MTPEKQRIAIAKACGFTDCPIDSDTMMYGQTPVPDYPNDLNAMHEAEKVLDDDGRYAANVWEIVSANKLYEQGREHDAWFLHIHATASQRAEAFLKTLNLWEETSDS